MALTILAFELIVVGIALAGGIAAGDTTRAFVEGGWLTTFSMWQLIVAAGMALVVWWARHREEQRPLWRAPYTSWGLAAAGLLFLAADERLEIHERLDGFIHQVLNITETGITDRLDDLLIALYGVIALLVIRVELLRSRAALPFFIAAFALLFGTVVCDVLTNRDDILGAFFAAPVAARLQRGLEIVEESLKVLSEGFFIGGLVAIVRASRRARASTSHAPQ